jgi:hypothetical protein
MDTARSSKPWWESAPILYAITRMRTTVGWSAAGCESSFPRGFGVFSRPADPIRINREPSFRLVSGGIKTSETHETPRIRMGRGFDEPPCPCSHGGGLTSYRATLCKDLLPHLLPTSQRRTDPCGSSATNPATSGMTGRSRRGRGSTSRPGRRAARLNRSRHSSRAFRPGP